LHQEEIAMNEQDAKAFCDRWLAAWTGNNPTGLLEYYDEHAYYQDPARPAGLRGWDELRKYFTRLLAANPDWVWEPVEVMPTPKGFTLKWKAAVPAGESTAQFVGLDIVEMDGGRITRNEVYFDTAAMKKG